MTPTREIPQTWRAAHVCKTADHAAGPACEGQSLVAAPYAGFSGTVSQALRPFPQYGTVTVDSATMDDPFGDYTYNALQAQVTKRTSSGLTVLASYSWSKNITNADSEYPTEAAWEGNDTSGALNTYNLKVEKALSQFDIPQRVVLAWTYDLPFGKGKKLANQGGVVNVLAGGWKIAAVQKYQRGTPLAVTSPGWTSGIFAGGEGATGSSSRPNIVPGVNPSGVGSSSKFVYGTKPSIQPSGFYAGAEFHLWRRAPRSRQHTRALQYKRGLQHRQGHPHVYRTGPNRLPRGVLRRVQPAPLHRL